MARLSRLLSAVSLGVAVTAAVGAAVVAVEHNPVRRAPNHLAESASHGRVIVKYKARSTILSAANSATSTAAAGTGPQKAGVLGARLGLALTDGRILGERTQVLKAAGMTSSALAAAIAADSEVEWAQVDHRRFAMVAPVDDPLYPNGLSTSVAPTGPASGQWYLRAPGTDTSDPTTTRTVVSSINIEPAWALTHGATSIVIGDVDTGITQHPDLDGKIIKGYDFISDVPTANDGDGRDADPSDPGDYVTAAENSDKNGDFYECNDADFPDDPPGSPNPVNSSWHGTQTASILGAATNNGTGMAGTAYNSPVIPARALGKCGGFDSDIAAAAQWAGGIAVGGVPPNPHPARVINMSLGGSGACTGQEATIYVDALTALRNKGVVVVAAAGNDEGLPVAVPANCKPAATDPDQTPIVIAVAAVRHAGDKVGFSDIGPEVTIAAPGGNCINTAAGTPCLYPIITAINSGTTAPVVNGGTYSDGLNNVSLGTSFATPMVAGTVALMLSAAPNLTNAQVVGILKSTARTFPTAVEVPVTSPPTPQPPVCTVPVAAKLDSSGNVITPASPAQDECICTTSTCGAGMLDAGAAVTAAAALSNGAAITYTGPTALASPTPASVAVGGTVTLSGTGSTAGSSGAAPTYQWAIADGDTFVTLGSATGSSVVVSGAAIGSGQVKLTVTDPTSGLSNSTTVGVTVTAAPPSSGGGGAANPAWLAALAVAGLLLRRRGRA